MPITSDGNIRETTNARIDSDRRAAVRFGEMDRRSFAERRKERMNEIKINEAIAGELTARTKLKYFVIGECIVSDTPERLRAGKPARNIELWFTSDLNQCRLFEKTLTADERIKYENEIAEMWDGKGTPVMFAALLTPAQRCEAFLRMLGKWGNE